MTITPSPDNPTFIDISQPGDVSWTGSAYNVENPAAPAPNVNVQWFCSTASGNPCPPAAGTDAANTPTLTYVINQLSPDTYTITFVASPNDPNYAESPATAITFTTSNSGA